MNMSLVFKELQKTKQINKQTKITEFKAKNSFIIKQNLKQKIVLL